MAVCLFGVDDKMGLYNEDSSDKSHAALSLSIPFSSGGNSTETDAE